jgi:hypothetical protein
VSVRQSQEAVALSEPETCTQAQACAPAREPSVPTALPAVQTAFSPLTRSGDSPSRADEARERLALLGARVAARAVSISAVAMRPPSIQENHAAHREAAAQWEAALIRWPRHAWGFGHTCAKATADWLLAITFSPVGAVLAVAFIIVCWFWL